MSLHSKRNCFGLRIGLVFSQNKAKSYRIKDKLSLGIAAEFKMQQVA